MQLQQLNPMEPMAAHDSVPSRDEEWASEQLDRQKNKPELEKEAQASHPPRDWRFWIVFPTLCLSGLAVTMEGSIVVTALPAISRALNTSEYVWVINAYTFASAVFQPLTGWLAEVFGRKPVMLVCIVLFGAGSGVAGAADALPVIIVGRLIQGVGGGGIPLVAELIISDMVPLPDRPKMLGIVMATSCLGLVLGPVIGGIVVGHTTWRWIFWINCPLAVASALCLFPILGQRTQQQRDAATNLAAIARRFDWVGNFLLPASTISILLPLTMGGKMYDWSSFRVILPLVLGVGGMIVFGIYEAYCPHPLIPLHLLRNVSAISLQLQNFIQSMLLMWVNYYLTIYFQAVLELSAQRAGFNLMPTIVGMVVFSILGGIVSAMLPGRQSIILNILAFSLMSIGLGVFTSFDATTSTAVHAVVQIVIAAGNGLLLATLLPALQGCFSADDVWSVTALFNYLRSFAMVWGVTIPSIVFDLTVDHHANQVPASARGLLVHGGAYAHASQSFIRSFQGTARDEVIALYVRSLRATWWGAMSFGLLGLVLVSLQWNQRPVGTAGKRQSAENVSSTKS
ncbi:major facilitator superfamily domain-containing protein [Trichoderma sp. SZMC 28015]